MPNTPIQEMTLGQLGDALIKLKALATTTTDPAVYAAANDSQARIDSQISVLQNLQLANDTPAMQAQADGIGQTKAVFDAAAKKLATASEVITGAAKFLDAVDVLIKVASRLA
jgi:hypothetical protein